MCVRHSDPHGSVFCCKQRINSLWQRGMSHADHCLLFWPAGQAWLLQTASQPGVNCCPASSLLFWKAVIPTLPYLDIFNRHQNLLPRTVLPFKTCVGADIQNAHLAESIVTAGSFITVLAQRPAAKAGKTALQGAGTPEGSSWKVGHQKDRQACIQSSVVCASNQHPQASMLHRSLNF